MKKEAEIKVSDHLEKKYFLFLRMKTDLWLLFCFGRSTHYVG